MIHKPYLVAFENRLYYCKDFISTRLLLGEGTCCIIRDALACIRTAFIRPALRRIAMVLRDVQSAVLSVRCSAFVALLEYWIVQTCVKHVSAFFSGQH